MNEKEIKQITLDWFANRKKENCDIIVFDEFGIKNGTSRIDIALIQNNLHGIEIKSDVDNLSRLPLQIEHYNSVFDSITLITTFKHAYKVINIIPEWWGLYLVDSENGSEITFYEARSPKRNRLQKKESIAKLLWKKELIELLEKNSISTNASMKKNDLISIIDNSIDIKFLKEFAYYKIKNRVDWRSV